MGRSASFCVTNVSIGTGILSEIAEKRVTGVMFFSVVSVLSVPL